jgi:peptidoglycan/xylan/chitin deacetylase (PgdA/CDA1 family)
MNSLEQICSSPSILSEPLHALLRQCFPQALWDGRGDRREIALSFDDGPHPQDTPRLLELLARQQVPATFFHVGKQVAQYPELVRQIAEAGHQVGIHGYRHRAFPLEPSATLRFHLARTRYLITQACQCDSVIIDLVRPPYGLFLPSTIQMLVGWGYRPVMWSVAPFHWMQSAQATIRQVQRQVTNGSLLVLHEGLPGASVRAFTEPIIVKLKDAGFQFITIDQMWHSAQLSENSSMKDV